MKLFDILFAAALSRLVSGGGGAGLTEDIKQALLDCFAHVAWTDDQGQTYYDALEDALYPLSRIDAVYTQGTKVVYPSDSLSSLKENLVVTAFYSDETSGVLSDDNYTLSGTLTVGTSIITAGYKDKTATFTVQVTPITVYQEGEDLYIVAGVNASQTDDTLSIT